MGAAVLARVLLVCAITVATAIAQELPPELTQPVNDFADVIDPASARSLESLIRSLQQSTGDVVVVATIDTYAPYADIREYAVKMFENRGRGIGERGRDNGLLILLAVKDREVWVEVGYELEEFITDGFSGETSRRDMIPFFRRGDYGEGLLAGTSRIINRIAEARNVTLQGARPERPRVSQPGSGGSLIVALFVLFLIINIIAGRLRSRRRFSRGWGRRGGWSSGVGPFGGGFGGGFGRGGGFGGGFGGFGGFGGGRSGGGGGGGSW
jgi:uncharacterized protein